MVTYHQCHSCRTILPVQVRTLPIRIVESRDSGDSGDSGDSDDSDDSDDSRLRLRPQELDFLQALLEAWPVWMWRRTGAGECRRFCKACYVFSREATKMHARLPYVTRRHPPPSATTLHEFMWTHGMGNWVQT